MIRYVFVYWCILGLDGVWIIETVPQQSRIISTRLCGSFMEVIVTFFKLLCSECIITLY